MYVMWMCRESVCAHVNRFTHKEEQRRDEGRQQATLGEGAPAIEGRRDTDEAEADKESDVKSQGRGRRP